MIYTLTDFAYLDISILLVFLIFCLSDFINNCKSNVDNVSSPNLALNQYQISSPDLPYLYRKNLPFEHTPETTFVEV